MWVNTQGYPSQPRKKSPEGEAWHSVLADDEVKTRQLMTRSVSMQGILPAFQGALSKHISRGFADEYFAVLFVFVTTLLVIPTSVFLAWTVFDKQPSVPHTSKQL